MSSSEAATQNRTEIPKIRSSASMMCRPQTSVVTFRTYTDYPGATGGSLGIVFYIHTDEAPEVCGRYYCQLEFLMILPVRSTCRNPERGVNMRAEARPIAGITVTIIAGTRRGESTLTDKNGRYLFADVAERELHLRVERERFEPKEVIVHRSRPTSLLLNGAVPNYHNDPQKTSGQHSNRAGLAGRSAASTRRDAAGARLTVCSGVSSRG